MVSNALNERANNASSEGFFKFKNWYRPFYTRYSQPLHRFEKLQTNSYPTETIIETEKLTNKERLIIEKDIITTLYLGGITVLALFVVSKFI